jgi:hypothetical protein
MPKIEITKENCIATTHPQIATQWHPTLNGELSPYDVRAGSTDRVWWLCDKGHEWKTQVRVRCQTNNGCPCCSGRNVIKGETDLESQRPDLAKEWDHKSNGDLTPHKISMYSPRKVAWICKKGHAWTAAVAKRVSRNQGCPYCSGRRAIPGETDIATQNPELMYLWDYEKNAAEDIYPENIKPHSDVETWWKCDKGHSWKTKTKFITRGHRCPYCVGYKVAQGETDLATVNPTLAAEWHPTKNKKLKPSDVMPHYSKKVWWKGSECGHEWKATVDHRSNGRGCPVCLGMKALVIDNSIYEVFPELSKEWDKDKNGDMNPKNTASRSNKKVWWKCNNGHSYEMAVNIKIRANNKTKELQIVQCPICSGKRIVKGCNDFTTLYPELIPEWDCEKNGRDPEGLAKSSKKKVWWKCIYNHSWKASIAVRTKGIGCPICAGKQILTGYNDLETLNPELAKEWHPTKNGGVRPNEISLNSHKKYWWLCNKGHEWEISPHNRNYGSGCPYCYGRFAIKGETDLATIMPGIAKEWHPIKNKGLKTSDVTISSHKKVWWLCRNEHEWQAAVYTRVISNGCPYCSGFKPIVGKTDFASIMPEIAEEWNYERNRGKTPQMYTKSSNKKVWWKCDLGHEWRTTINVRTGLGTGCPECAKNRRK